MGSKCPFTRLSCVAVPIVSVGTAQLRALPRESLALAAFMVSFWESRGSPGENASPYDCGILKAQGGLSFQLKDPETFGELGPQLRVQAPSYSGLDSSGCWRIGHTVADTQPAEAIWR